MEGKKPGFKLEKVGQVSCRVCLTSEIGNFKYLQLRLCYTVVGSFRISLFNE